MCFWSTVAVELLDPIVQELVRENSVAHWESCERCGRAFSSVMNANLTFFQSIVCGDSWGYLAIPIIERAPGTILLFVGAQFSIVFGILQLIICVIVDSFSELRSKDMRQRALDMHDEEVSEKAALSKIFN
jgi:hypothetical protein